MAAWLRGQPEQDLFISVVTVGEIERGIHLEAERNPVFAGDLRRWLDATLLHFSDRILPFRAEDARLWGSLSARLGHSGADLMIAAQALAGNSVVVTRNVSDFTPTGARVFDPS